MPAPRYPLEPLVTVRGRKVEAAVQGLADAVRSRETAEGARRASEERRDAHDRAAEAVRGQEREALGRGELRAADLLAAGAWEARMRAETSAMATAVERARGAEAAAREAEGGARGQVATRKADAQVVDEDRDRWLEGQRKKAEAQEEEEAAEAYRPSR